MKTLVIIWIAVVTLLLHQNVPAQDAPAAPATAQVPEYICPRATGAITLDGVLNELAWQSAPVIDGFMTLGPQGEKAKNMSRVRLLLNDNFLYIGGELTTLPDKLPHTLKESKRDVAVWGCDAIDIFLQPRESKPELYYQFLVSAHGYLHDAKYGLGTANAETWNSQAEVKTQQRPGGWSFEIGVPFADLGGSPKRGEVWVFRFGLAADGYQLAMWPQNREQGFHNKSCRAYLIFETPELVTGGDFEQAVTNAAEPPAGWRYAVNTDKTDPGNPGRGSIRMVTLPDAPAGPHAVEIDKTDDLGYFPALLFENIPVEPGATYEFSAYVKSEKSFHAGVSFTGPETKDPKQRYYVQGERNYPAAPAFQKITARYRVDERIARAGIIFRYQNNKGKLWVDGVSFKRVNGLSTAVEAVKEADTIHNLGELSLRTQFKPFWLLKQSNGWYRNERAIFKDTGTGATIWKMSRNPSYVCCHQYMEMPPWNCNGQRLVLCSLMEYWRIEMKPDGSAWIPMEQFGANQWDRFDPDILWRLDGSNKKLLKYSMASGKSVVIREFKGYLAVWPMSNDGKYLLLGETVVINGKQSSLIHLVPRDVSAGGEGIITVDPQAEIHQLWFTNRPDYSFVFGYEDYVRGGAVMTPDGKVVKYLKFEDGVLPGGHQAISPAGKWAVKEDGYIYDWLTGERVRISDHLSSHQSWGRPEGAWYAGSSGYNIRRFGIPPRRFDQLLGSANSMMKYGIYWAEEHPAVSPDGTKVCYASNMMGYIDLYVLIMRWPDSPGCLKVAVQEDRKVRLEWRAPKHAKELEWYRIYHSDDVVGPYREVATVPAGVMSHIPATSPNGYFVVTAQEYSGLESNYSNPVAVERESGSFLDMIRSQDWKIQFPWKKSSRQGAFLASAEAETGVYENPGEEVFDPLAANLYAVVLGRDVACSNLTLNIELPSDEAKGNVFARVRSMMPEDDPKMEMYVNNTKAATVLVKDKAWHWVKLNQEGAMQFKPGTVTVKFVPLNTGIFVDQVVVADDSTKGFEPFWGKDHQNPGLVRGVKAEAVDSYNVSLSWEPPRDAADIAYYNLYAARGSMCKPGNETLIASPTEPKVIDWGLAAGSAYAYRITAVDRAGNESAPSEVVVLTTPPVKDRVFFRQACSLRTKGEAKLDVPLQLDKPGEAVFWVKVRCFNQNPVSRFKVLLDNKELREPWQVPWHFVTPHHPGPAKDVWLWCCIEKPFKESADGKKRLLPVPAGTHTLALVPDTEFNKQYGNIDVEIGEVVITNDKGYVPAGIVNFLIDPDRGR